MNIRSTVWGLAFASMWVWAADVEIDVGVVNAISVADSEVQLADKQDELLSSLKFDNTTLTIQNNRMVGHQLIDVRLGDSASASVNVLGQSINPGETQRVSVSFPDAETVSIPVQVNSQGIDHTLPISLNVAEIRSDLDVTPTVSLTTLPITEGDSGSFLHRLNFTLDVPIGHATSFDYYTEDGSAQATAGLAKNIAYDIYGNPFISVIDSATGGRIVLDGGFPKQYNSSDSPSLSDAQKYMRNAIKWVSDPDLPSRILLLGDLPLARGGNYRVKGTGGADFRYTFQRIAAAVGVPIDIIDVNDIGGEGRASMTLEQLQAYQAIIFMGSNYHTFPNSAFSDTLADNFAKYFLLGGGGIFITDHDIFQASVNHILSRFGVQFYGNVNRTPMPVSELVRLYGHSPLYDGLTVVAAGGSEGNVNLNGLASQKPDYEGRAGTITFASGETEQFLDIRIFSDTDREADETFDIFMNNAQGLILSEDKRTLTIDNDD